MSLKRKVCLKKVTSNEISDTRIIAPWWPTLVKTFKLGEHLLVNPSDTMTVCGKQIKDDYVTEGGDISKCACKKCQKAFWKKYNSIHGGGYEINLHGNLKYRKAFRFCEKAPFVERVSFKKLNAGDIVYMEEGSGEGELIVYKDGEFLFIVTESPKVIGVDEAFKPTNWFIKEASIPSFCETFKALANFGIWKSV